jgi:hypothetical protein
MIQRTSQVLFAYWNEMRAGRIAPRRFEIEPSRIGSILSETFILERLSGEQYRFRLAGTKLCEHLGHEMRGRNFLDAWDHADRAALEQDLAAATERGGVVVLTFEASASADPGSREPGRGKRRSVSFEALLLPLVHTNDTLDRYLGCMSPIDPPEWIGRERLTDRTLLRSDVVWPDGRPFPVVDKARNQTPFLPEIRNARLVKSDRRQFRVYDGGLSKNPPRTER